MLVISQSITHNALTFESFLDAHFGEIVALTIAALSGFSFIMTSLWRRQLKTELAIKKMEGLTDRVDSLEAKIDKDIEQSHGEHADMRKENAQDHKEVRAELSELKADVAELKGTVISYIKQQQQK